MGRRAQYWVDNKETVNADLPRLRVARLLAVSQMFYLGQLSYQETIDILSGPVVPGDDTTTVDDSVDFVNKVTAAARLGKALIENLVLPEPVGGGLHLVGERKPPTRRKAKRAILPNRRSTRGQKRTQTKDTAG